MVRVIQIYQGLAGSLSQQLSPIKPIEQEASVIMASPKTIDLVRTLDLDRALAGDSYK